jgi:hypothetical protein
MSTTDSSIKPNTVPIGNSTSAVGAAFYESTADPTNIAYFMANKRVVTYGIGRNQGIRLPNLTKSPETEQILKDPIIMDALKRSDLQFIEGKAKPLRKLMADLGFEEDELLY